MNEWNKYTAANGCASVRLYAHSEAHILSNVFIQSSMCWSIANKSVLNRNNRTNCQSIEINMPTMQCSQSITNKVLLQLFVKLPFTPTMSKMIIIAVHEKSHWTPFLEIVYLSNFDFFFNWNFIIFWMNFGVVETHDFQLKQNKKLYSIHGVRLGVNHVKWLFNNSIISILNWSRMVM